MEDDESQHESSVGWVNKPPEKPVRSWDSGSSGVMAVRKKKNAELRVTGAKYPIKVNGRKTSVWVDSGSPISILTIGEPAKKLGAADIKLQENKPKDLV